MNEPTLERFVWGKPVDAPLTWLKPDKVMHTREHTQHVLARMVLLQEQQELSILKARARLNAKKQGLVRIIYNCRPRAALL
jgi:hypothetical protein